MSDSLWSHGLQPNRLLCPPLSARLCSNSCPLSWQCYLNGLIHSLPLLLLPSIFPRIRVFSNESVLLIRRQNYWSFSISHSNEYSGLISWFDLLTVQSTLKCLLQSKALSNVFSRTTVWKYYFFGAQPSLWSNCTSVHNYWENHSCDYMDLCHQSDVSDF